MKLQRLQTTNLFYNRYVYKLRVKNKIGSIFRGMNLGFAKSKIDSKNPRISLALHGSFFDFLLGSGLKYGLSVSINNASSGIFLTTSCRSIAFLKVIIPVKDI